MNTILVSLGGLLWQVMTFPADKAEEWISSYKSKGYQVKPVPKGMKLSTK